jgi:CheY-like chemotaxis protein
MNLTEFMKMSINRCMDFAKVANHGLKLAPKYETVEVLEAIHLPLKCMMSVDPEQAIHLNPLPENLCTHVITDAQWLQENILCLTSNAAKYSSHGTITLSVHLHSESSLLSAPAALEGLGPLGSRTRSDKFGDREFSATIDTVHDDEQGMSGSSMKSVSGFDAAQEAGATMKPSSVEKDKLMVVIEVEDTGVGLSESARANLFAPFKQAQRLAGGTGLGLFSLANRMEALHGHCGVRSRRDGAQGSLFWFAFPYKPDAEAAAAALETDLTAESLAQLGMQRPPLPEHFTAPSPPRMLHMPSGESLEVLPQYLRRGNSRALLSISTALLSAADNQSSSGPCTPMRDWHPPRRAYGSIVTPRAARQLPARQSPLAPRNTPRPSCPPSPSDDGDRPVSGSYVSTSPSVDTDMMAAENALHILLVDDTPSILKICTRTLLREGYRVSTAENGFEALKLLTAASFDAVLMDLQMPVLDGLETVRRFRANEQVVPGKRRQFIVAVSANSDPAVAKGVIECGFDGFIEKPFTVKRLQAILPADL